MRALGIILSFVVLISPAQAQRIAIIQPIREGRIIEFSTQSRAALARDVKVLDDSLADAAYRSVAVEDPFNLSTAEARRIGSVTGTDHFVLLRTAVQRRAALNRSAYFEAYAVIYLANSRTGTLDLWHLESAEGPTADAATARLLDRTTKVADKIKDRLKATDVTGVADKRFEEVPPENSPLANGLRTPIPYRRIRPQYTELASNYGIRATIDIEVDIDSDGSIVRTRIERWAGFGLDESVEKAVRSMNWRPAERNGKFLPMRVLLRYNFTKLEKDEAP